jgi:hypothetical protein
VLSRRVIPRSVLAMHQIMVAILVRHAHGNDWHRRIGA